MNSVSIGSGIKIQVSPSPTGIGIAGEIVCNIRSIEIIPGVIHRNPIDQSLRSPWKRPIDLYSRRHFCQVRIFELKRAKMPFSALAVSW
jgi:hypothetical protein